MTTAEATPKAARKTAAKPAAEKKPAATEPKKRTPRKKAALVISPEERQHLIEVAAYYIAERQNFAGDSHADWLQAEQEIDALIAAGKIGG